MKPYVSVGFVVLLFLAFGALDVFGIVDDREGGMLMAALLIFSFAFIDRDQRNPRAWYGAAGLVASIAAISLVVHGAIWLVRWAL